MREFVGERRGKNRESALFSGKRKHLQHRRLLPLSLSLSLSPSSRLSSLCGRRLHRNPLIKWSERGGTGRRVLVYKRERVVSVRRGAREIAGEGWRGGGTRGEARSAKRST
jgi:hypothetical protein